MRYLYFLLLLSFPVLSFTQDIKQNVIGTAGDDFKTNEVSVSWTLGEVVSEHFSSESYNLSQGFHQGNLVVNRINEEYPIIYQLKAYPNPVKDILIIELQDQDSEYQLIDAEGQVILNGMIHSSQEQIDFTGLSSGTYFLQVDKYKTHVIIKN